MKMIATNQSSVTLIGADWRVKSLRSSRCLFSSLSVQKNDALMNLNFKYLSLLLNAGPLENSVNNCDKLRIYQALRMIRNCTS